MKLSCPSCKTSFSVPDQALQPAGRTVRCSRCAQVWFAGPDGQAAPPPVPATLAVPAPLPAAAAPPAAPVPAPAAPPPLPSLVTATVPEPVATTPATDAAERAGKPDLAVRHPMRAILGWAAFVLVAAVVACSIYFHEVFAAEFPATRPIYRVTKLMSALPLEGLRFTTTSDPDLSQFHGRDLPPVVKVTVAIVNESWRPRSIRTLRGMTVGENGRVLTSWEPALTRRWLWPGERTTFTSDVSLAGQQRPTEIQFKLDPIE